MLQVETTEAFDAWHLALDKLTRARIAARLVKLSAGLRGDCKSVGGGVTELREDFGPGWRMYYVQREGVLIVMLGGGDKSTQQDDITAAQALAFTLMTTDDEDQDDQDR